MMSPQQRHPLTNDSQQLLMSYFWCHTCLVSLR